MAAIGGSYEIVRLCKIFLNTVDTIGDVIVTAKVGV